MKESDYLPTGLQTAAFGQMSLINNDLAFSCQKKQKLEGHYVAFLCFT